MRGFETLSEKGSRIPRTWRKQYKEDIASFMSFTGKQNKTPPPPNLLFQNTVNDTLVGTTVS